MICKNTCVRSVAILNSLYSTKYLYLVSLLSIISIKLYLILVYRSVNSSSLTTKSIVINSYGYNNMFSDLRNL